FKQVEQKAIQEGAEAGEKVTSKSVGAFSEVKGHHVHAKAGFEGAKGYDPMKAFAVSDKALQSHGVKHSQVTGQQIKLFTQAGKNGAANNITTHSRVAYLALVGAGIPKEVAKKWVLASQSQLIKIGTTVPTKIPWVK
ncbi:MAG TPA: hypothetical protein VFM18_14835, partial [Methanosarcina sp.]|nr:hypothetical protein [Methanosarcina sp.]